MGLSFTTENIKAIILRLKRNTRRLTKEGEHFVEQIYVGEVFAPIPASVYTRLGKNDVGVYKYRLKYQVGRTYKLVAGRTLPQVYYRIIDNEIDLAHKRDCGKWLLFKREHDLYWRETLESEGWQPLSYRITGLREEPLQDISEADAIAEGVERDEGTEMYLHYYHGEHWCYTAKESYITQWDSLHAKKGNGWDTNPIVHVIEFEEVSATRAAIAQYLLEIE